MMALLSFGNKQRTGAGFQPRLCSICDLPITEVSGWNQSAHSGACKQEQKRRYLAKVAEDAKRRRKAEKLK